MKNLAVEKTEGPRTTEARTTEVLLYRAFKTRALVSRVFPETLISKKFLFFFEMGHNVRQRKIQNN